MESEVLQIIQETYCKLAPSKIHGIGVFAIRDIPRGQKLYLVPKRMVKWYKTPYSTLKARLITIYPQILELILERWPSIINGSHFVSPNDMAIMAAFVNHSSEANYSVDTDCALRDIRQGEEVTEDYKLMKNFQIIYPWIRKTE